jgi:hypothetical protein
VSEVARVATHVERYVPAAALRNVHSLTVAG